MKKGLVVFTLCITVMLMSFTLTDTVQDLRDIYARPVAAWPAPTIDPSVQWTELGVLPKGPFAGNPDSVKALVELGKILFFDTRLSGSGKISCGTCHQPELSWTDGKARSEGHEGMVNKRNAPSIQHVWFYKKLFWDGRSTSLEDQAFAPINSESEMHHDMRALPRQLQRIPVYRVLFHAAFADSAVTPDRIGEALATFQRTIGGRNSRFDAFLSGDKNALSNAEIKGLHLFRTKARCMNCHYGPLFSDNQFHNNGFAKDDKGLYAVTHRDEDIGKMKTPSLRDVMFTRPWMHDGTQKEIGTILHQYNTGSVSPNTDILLHPLKLSRREKNDLAAFLQAISAPPLEFNKPVTPD